jgi:hypothetical protein
MSNVPSRGSFSSFISFSSRQTNVIKDKVRTTIERIRSHAQNLTGVRSKDASKLDSSKMTIEENEELLDGLKLLFDESDYDEQSRLLTIAPSSWGRSRIEAFFSCNDYQARKSLVIRDSLGILQRPIDSRGNIPLDNHIAQAIVQFYQDNGISRKLASKKDIVHVKKQPIPLRFMCMTVGKAYALFMSSLEASNPNTTVSATTFYSLRPRWVKIKTPHDVCVCAYHENFRLLTQVCSLMMNEQLNTSDL